MDAIEFACLLHRIQYNICVHIDSDVIYMIYQEYINPYYNKYTLFELLSMLDSKKIYVSCAHNKNALIKFILANKIDIPSLLSDDEHKTKWSTENLQYLDYTTYPHVTHVNKYIMCIHETDTRTELSDGDIFVIDKTRYKIISITQDNIVLENMDTVAHEKTSYTIQQFITMLDTIDTITMQRNQQRNRLLSYV